MPSFFTHQVIAEEVLKAIPNDLYTKIEYYDCYYAGAQGADPFFIYRPFKKKGYNLGKTMHRKKVFEFFSAAYDNLNATDNPRGRAYLYGYITHYAVDTIFHPYVYWLEKELVRALPKSRKKDKVHFRIERDIDVFIYEEYRHANLKDYVYDVTLSEADYRGIFAALSEPLWDVYSVRADYDALHNSLKRFVKQQKYFLDPKNKRGTAMYALEKLLFFPHILSFMYIRENPDMAYTNYLKEQTPYGNDSIYDLADKAIRLGAKLIAAFDAAPPEKELFSTDFNLGKD